MVGEGSSDEIATRWSVAIADTGSAAARAGVISDGAVIGGVVSSVEGTPPLQAARCTRFGTARVLAPARACTMCQRVTMPTISASLSAALTDGQVQHSSLDAAFGEVESIGTGREAVASTWGSRVYV